MTSRSINIFSCFCVLPERRGPESHQCIFAWSWLRVFVSLINEPKQRLAFLNGNKDAASMCADSCTHRHSLAISVPCSTSCLCFLRKTDHLVARIIVRRWEPDEFFFFFLMQTTKMWLAARTTAEPVAVRCNTSNSRVSLLNSELPSWLLPYCKSYPTVKHFNCWVYRLHFAFNTIQAGQITLTPHRPTDACKKPLRAFHVCFFISCF